MTTTPARQRLGTCTTFALLASLSLTLGVAHADTLPADGGTAPGTVQQAQPAPETGTMTRQWVQAQGQREQASATRQTLSGPVMRRVHDRYLKSFETDVPTRLRDSEPFGKR